MDIIYWDAQLNFKKFKALNLYTKFFQGDLKRNERDY